MNTKQYLIIGNGAAGVSAAEIIRQRDPAGHILILTHEPYPLYSRPGIAYFLLGQVSAPQIMARSEAFYQRHRLQLRVGWVTEVDPVGQVVRLADGATLHYDVLLLATGSTAVAPTFPGGDLDGVVTFDTLDDAKNVIKRARRARQAVIVGGGITAMELAEGIRHRGVKTHFLQRRDRIWSRLFDDRESAIIEAQIRHEKIELHYRSEIQEVIGKRGKVAGVQLTNGDFLKCQLVGVAIGVRPNVKLVQKTAVQVDRGIMVNAALQSNVPTLFAAGDVAQVYDRWTGQHHLDILWPSAISEGQAAGHNMVDVAHGQLPTFQYQKGMPFNAALLFGLHITIIGRIGSAAQTGNPDVAEVAYLSRGSSHVWTTPFQSQVRSAWDKNGPNSVRVTLQNGRFVGALIIGEQRLADPLRRLIESEKEVSRFEADLLSGGELPAVLKRIAEGI